jgi:hypothetical protein
MLSTLYTVSKEKKGSTYFYKFGCYRYTYHTESLLPFLIAIDVWKLANRKSP